MTHNERQFTLTEDQVDFIIQECKTNLERAVLRFGDYFIAHEVECTLDPATTKHLVAVTTLLNAMVEAREVWHK